jgi:hypothetical protein
VGITGAGSSKITICQIRKNLAGQDNLTPFPKVAGLNPEFSETAVWRSNVNDRQGDVHPIDKMIFCYLGVNRYNCLLVNNNLYITRCGG